MIREPRNYAKTVAMEGDGVGTPPYGKGKPANDGGLFFCPVENHGELWRERWLLVAPEAIAGVAAHEAGTIGSFLCD